MTINVAGGFGHRLGRWLGAMGAVWSVLGVSLSVAHAAEPEIVTLASSSPLVHIKIMVRAGSAMDPPGLEGLARLSAELMIDGGFGEPPALVTKEKLAEMTRPWGTGAYPEVRVAKETTTFSFLVPADVLKTYTQLVLRPLFTQPQFDAKELQRLRGESLQALRSLRLEAIETLGLLALDDFVHAGTSYAHPDLGTESGLGKISVDAVRAFAGRFYRPENMVVGVASSDPQVVARVRQSLAQDNVPAGPAPSLAPPPAIHGRHVRIVALPNAISTGLHAGFPLPISRSDDDYWPLYVANIWLGTHRDGFGHLYQTIREERGYNYGDYSYIEHFADRPSALFPPTNTPRQFQYFSLWIRPVQHEYALHIMKAMTFELEQFVRTGLTPDQVEAAKNKARVLYLSLAEDTDRLLGYRLDDTFYRLHQGYLDQYLQRIDAVTCDQVNAAIRKYLQVDNLKYVIVTDDQVAPQLAKSLAADDVARGKTLEDYQIPFQESQGEKTFLVPEAKLDVLRRDAAWANYRLHIPADQIEIVPADKMFE